MRRLGLSMKFGRYTAHRRTQHASGARQQDPSPTCPILSFGLPHSVPDARAVPSNPEPGCRADHGAAPAILGLSNGEMPSMFTNLVAFPLGFGPWFCSSVFLGRDGRAARTVPADESTCGERAALASESHTTRNSKPRGGGIWRRQSQSLCRLDRTKCPQRTVPAPAIYSGALPSSSCNFAGVSQR